ncbi:MAG: hypothetical protein IT581_09155 [Verrucomicrobiales bacterium]|nr:hypothetical protein [Verrucomicrobiales bacterium]
MMRELCGAWAKWLLGFGIAWWVALAAGAADSGTSGPRDAGLAAGDARASEVPPSGRLFMMDGQLHSHLISVWVSARITEEQKPRLRLFQAHSLTKVGAGENEYLVPREVIPDQRWPVELDDAGTYERVGTVLLFELKDRPFNGKAMLRFAPILEWEDQGAVRKVLGLREVNVGHIVNASLWTLGILATVVVLVLIVCRISGRSPVGFIRGTDGRLSLSQAQVLCWTMCTGGVVLGYGLIRVQIPEIPSSILVLMGASLVTGGVGYRQDSIRGGSSAPATKAKQNWKWSDLVSDSMGELSLSRAQMVFWTWILLVLFVSKTVLEGRIWEVPWTLVALMGFSQAGYLAPKIFNPPAEPVQK